MKNFIEYYSRIYRQYGLSAVLFLVRSKFRSAKTTNIQPAGVKYPLELSNFTCDVTTLFKIFYSKEYDIQLNETPSVIIDCGANVGLSAVFFANKYPDAKIVAIEPDEQNFKFLKQNTTPYKNVICLKKAVWSDSLAMKLNNVGTGSWGFQTAVAAATDTNTIDSITIPEIMESNGFAKIDLLKIDIEGAEKELFSANFDSWLPKTKVIAIELHGFLDKEIPDIFYNTISQYSFKCYDQGENVICVSEL